MVNLVRGQLEQEEVVLEHVVEVVVLEHVVKVVVLDLEVFVVINLEPKDQENAAQKGVLQDHDNVAEVVAKVPAVGNIISLRSQVNTNV